MQFPTLEEEEEGLVEEEKDVVVIKAHLQLWRCMTCRLCCVCVTIHPGHVRMSCCFQSKAVCLTSSLNCRALVSVTLAPAPGIEQLPRHALPAQKPPSEDFGLLESDLRKEVRLCFAFLTPTRPGNDQIKCYAKLG